MSRATQGYAMLHLATCTGLSPATARLSRLFHSQDSCNVAALLPRRGRNLRGLGCAPFARHYWGYHCCFLFLRVLRCFSSPGLPPHQEDDRSSTGRVVPFGNPRINGHLRLPAAYRSLSRPSSPVRAKASAMCPFTLSPYISACHNIYKYDNRRNLVVSTVVTLTAPQSNFQLRILPVEGETLLLLVSECQRSL